jgi:hypothetical protein
MTNKYQRVQIDKDWPDERVVTLDGEHHNPQVLYDILLKNGQEYLGCAITIKPHHVGQEHYQSEGHIRLEGLGYLRLETGMKLRVSEIPKSTKTKKSPETQREKLLRQRRTIDEKLSELGE